MKGNREMIELLKDNKHIKYFETENKALEYLHKYQPQSWDYAFNYGGYEMKEVNVKVTNKMYTLTKPEKEILQRTYERNLDLDNYDQRIILTHAISRLRRISFKLRRLYEDDCNGNPTPKIERRDGKTYRYNIQDTKRAEKNQRTEDRLEAEAQEIADKYKLAIRIQSDPRGAPIKLALHPDDKKTVDYIGANTDILC
jgi:hypothetical protein